MTTRRYRYVEFVYWVAAVAGAILVVLAVPSLLFGDGLLTLKYALFVVGFLVFGVGSFAIQPSPRGRGPVSRLFSVSLDGRRELGFERRIMDLPPLDDAGLHRSDCVSRDVKIFAASLVLLGVSAFLEFGLDITVG